MALRFYKPYRDPVHLQEPLKAIHGYQTQVDPDASASDILQDPGSGNPLFEDRTLADVVRRCRESTSRLEITLAFASLRSLISLSSDDAENFQKKMELCGIRSAKGAKRQLLLTCNSEIPEVELLKGCLEEYDIPLRNSNPQFSTYVPEGSTIEQEVILEYKKHDPVLPLDYLSPEMAMAQGEKLSKFKRSMRQLAAVLQESSFGVDDLTNEEGPGLESIGAFRCLGLMEDPDRSQYVLLFEIPPGLTAQSLASCYLL